MLCILEREREMEDMVSLWSHQESIDELKQKLLYTTLELESVRMEANEEMRKSREYVKQLMQLLNMAYQERDEARDQHHKLLNQAMSCEFFTPLTQTKPAKANSSITESNSFGSSPVDSLFDPISSPEQLSNGNVESPSHLAAFVNQPFVSDPSGLVIEKAMKGKSLPQKGKFLQAVLEAGPLLQTLLVAGPLPRWRNPPPLQPLQIPPVSISDENLGFVPSSSSFIGVSCGSSRMLTTTSVLDIDSGASGYFPSGKRQKFQ
ncbi:Kinetochore protein like [Actinidia chinensis var. chinensis]|uniref:Kinetochore protein like n=2 Tax=Actinidia TaxID=3624 RepID=A0A2R6PQ22_ACTCC|nr:Kinetochore protein like [Actinidia chinensis var. chinensis]